MRWLLIGLLPGCVYVTRGEYLALWDADGDGWPLDEDCAPDDPDVFPFAADRRGDGCDSDCGTEPDADADDWPDAADCGVDDPDVHPCSAAEVDGDGIDSDCDGLDSARVDVCEGLDPDHPEAEPVDCRAEPSAERVIALLLALAPAGAQTSCGAPMSRIQLGAALGEVTDALEDGDQADAARRLADLAVRMPCLSEPADPALVARYDRYQAIVLFVAHEEGDALRWALASRLADPELPWDETRWPATHPLRVVVDGTPTPPTVRSDGGFRLPDGGAVYLNGRFAAAPEAAELPYLAQRFDSEGQRIDGQWLEGPTFPDEWLAAGAGEVSPPKPAAVARAPRRRAPVGTLIASGALLAVSGASYALAGRSASSMEGLSTSEDLTAARSRANAFVVASGATFAGAVGVGLGAVVSW